MGQEAESPELKARKEVFEELERIVQLDDSGRAEAEALWGMTLGNFFVHGDRAAAKWRIPAVREYGMSAVTDIAHEAKQLAAGRPASGSNLRRAAIIVIKKYRPPEEIGGGMGYSPLCQDFRLK